MTQTASKQFTVLLTSVSQFLSSFLQYTSLLWCCPSLPIFKGQLKLSPTLQIFFLSFFSWKKTLFSYSTDFITIFPLKHRSSSTLFHSYDTHILFLWREKKWKLSHKLMKSEYIRFISSSLIIFVILFQTQSSLLILLFKLLYQEYNKENLKAKESEMLCIL